MSPRRNMPTRNALFAMGVFVVFFVLLELGSSAFEHLNPPRTGWPEPSPDAPAAGIEKAASDARLLQGIPPRERIPCPLLADQMVGWKLPPELTAEAYAIGYRVNSLGYRGAEFEPKRPGTVRLMTVGDSTIFGDGVAEKDIFSSVAARELAAAWGVEVDTIIGALPGHDTAQSLMVLRQVAPLQKPDWVVIGNLWSDIYRRDRMQWKWGEGSRSLDSLEPLRTLAGRSASYRVGRRLLKPHLAERKVGFIGSIEDIGSITGGPATRILLKEYIENLRTMATFSQNLGARPLFLQLPAPLDLSGGAIPDTVVEYRVAMRMVASEFNAPLVDGPALFRDHGVTIAWFFDIVHPIQEGHALLGESVAQTILGVQPRP